MKCLSQTDYKIMPWKNGGGTTTEIAIYPENTDISGGVFIWRVSIADVASDGPFSRFPGFDRHIMLIAGNGMILDAESEGKIFLDELYKPASFSGDWLIEGTLQAGPVRDFNLISARNSVINSSLHGQILTDRSTFEAQAGNVIIHVLEGKLLVSGRVLAGTESVILSPGERLDVTPLSGKAILAVARITLT